jgi:hypothetical protein
VFLFDVREERGIAEIALAAGTDEISRFISVGLRHHRQYNLDFINSKYINNYMLNYQKTQKGRYASFARVTLYVEPTFHEPIWHFRCFSSTIGGSCPGRSGRGLMLVFLSI